MTEKELILKMAKAMKPNSFWSDDRSFEKGLVTMATNAFKAIRPYIKINEQGGGNECIR